MKRILLTLFLVNAVFVSACLEEEGSVDFNTNGDSDKEAELSLDGDGLPPTSDGDDSEIDIVITDGDEQVPDGDLTEIGDEPELDKEHFDKEKYDKDYEKSDKDSDKDFDKSDKDFDKDYDKDYDKPAGTCKDDSDCKANELCHEFCADDSKGDCILKCTEHNCQTEPYPLCNQIRPDCGVNSFAVVKNGCWECVSIFNCLPHDASCDDGTRPTCKMAVPDCSGREILAYQKQCYVCVNPKTCKPFSQDECKSDSECAEHEWCNPCINSTGTGTDCVSACENNRCRTEKASTCDSPRPDCGKDGVSVIRNGCWTCLSHTTCRVYDSLCNAFPLEDVSCMPIVEPTCQKHEWMTIQNSCYVCVNPITCKPWGQNPGCKSDWDCAPWETCDSCATSSGVMLSDCVAGCKIMKD